LSRLKSKFGTSEKKPLRKKVDAYVSEVNLRGQLFLKANKFKAVGIEKNYFDEFGEDAYHFTYGITDGTADVPDTTDEDE